MNIKGIEVRDKLFVARMTEDQRKKVYETARLLGMSGADFLILASGEKAKEVIGVLRQKPKQKTDANLMSKSA